jgi:hypothetical protein
MSTIGQIEHANLVIRHPEMLQKALAHRNILV